MGIFSVISLKMIVISLANNLATLIIFLLFVITNASQLFAEFG